ncbi:hypothetical protein PaecuDRAFT_3584 [Paenibacillus curdlanolyticus YK9]|uniref:Uncharacterized protein n=1 Tax=Paenibacillus curdlanolyticus YK9 TaxID=717606 RepID=E0ID82_9BACL|nr:hypothetical protein [Paenibacillus curdlanolyticus]EFM09537.1 hypothetical protein PaecuDRAFT_3584 [Paenibacillus curdlanolyticus YK9]
MQSEIRTQSIHLLKDGHARSRVTDLFAQWDAFNQASFLDNIYFEVFGVDRTPFSSVVNEIERRYLIDHTGERLAHAFGHQHADIYPLFNENKLVVLWFPPYPICLNQLTPGEKRKLEKAVTELLQSMRLIVHDISFSEVTDGSGYEEFFYDRYYVPKQFNEMLGLQQKIAFENAPVENDSESTPIPDFLQDHTLEDLENAVQCQLQPPYQFKVSGFCEDLMISARKSEYFMPHFKVYLDLDEATTLHKIVKLVEPKFTIVEANEVNGKACIECIAHEGPFAETIGDIITNIHNILGPHLLNAFYTLGFNNFQLHFSLHVLH